ncbi:hypothetical protein V1505DRAFT_337805 [Lipomyces doorenjongii]
MDTIPTRISLQSHLGTLRYRGPLTVWPNTIALGIEWDEETRGKHSGSHNGVAYFETSVPNSATFVKVGRKFDKKRSFLEALKERYAPDKVDELEKVDITFGNKVAERVGFDKIRKLQAQLDKLSLVALDRQCIAYPSDGLCSFCPSIQDLDLSCNLFDHLVDVAKITVQLPRLQLLRLNGNRIISWELPEKYEHAFLNIQVISLASTLIPLESISRLPKLFPAARECCLSRNYLASADIYFSVTWRSLESLDLSYNRFTTIPSLKFPDGATLRITSLNVSHNSISEIQATSWTEHTPSLKALDLRHNNLKTWKDVDTLASQFTTITDVTIQWNPFMDGLAYDDVQLAVIARWASLTALNGAKIDEKERMNAEIFFMAKVAKRQVAEFDLDCPRWKQLCDIYGPPVNSEAGRRSSVLGIVFLIDSEEKSRKVPRGLTVQKLKILVAKWYKIPAAFVELALIDDDGTELIFEDSLREIEFYGVEDGSEIKIRVKR